MDLLRQVADIQTSDMLKWPVPALDGGKARIVVSKATPQLTALVSSLADRAARLPEVLDRFPHLRERLHSQASTLSGGEQKQLEIARALLLRPGVLLIDEPSIGLSPIVAAGVFRLLRGLADAGTTVLMSWPPTGCRATSQSALPSPLHSGVRQCGPLSAFSQRSSSSGSPRRPGCTRRSSDRVGSGAGG
mgnify:CR=1 FL=1